MISPQTITETWSIIAPINQKRFKLFIKNIGNKDVYITRQINAVIPNIPSSSNYDIKLAKGEEIEIRSVAQYNAVVIQGSDKEAGQSTEITVMETVYL